MTPPPKTEGNIVISHRHLVPLFSIFFITIAISLSKFIDNGKIIKKIVSYFVLISLLLLGFFSYINMPYREPKITYFDLDGFSYRQLGVTDEIRFGLNFNKYLEQGEKIDSDYKHYYYLGVI